jgi:hypothetical protein
MAIDKCLSWKRSEQARGQDRDEWGRFCKVRRGSTSNDGSSTDATYTKDTSTDGRYSRGKSIDYGSSDGEYSGTFEIDSMSSEHQDRVVQECESSRKAKKMEEMDKAAVKKQKNRDAVGMGKSYYIDLISSDEEEMGPKPYLTASNWDKKRRDMENGTDKKGKKKTSDVKSSDKGGQEKGKKVSSTI